MTINDVMEDTHNFLYYMEEDLDYPIKKFITDFRKSETFLQTFENPKFGFITMLCSKSDPGRLLFSLYTLLYMNILPTSMNYGTGYFLGWEITVKVLNKYDFEQTLINLETCKNIVNQIRSYYSNQTRLENYGYDYNKYPENERAKILEIDEKCYNDVLLFVFYEDFTDTTEIKIKNIYTVIEWFIEVSSKLYPSMKIIHMKSIENNRVHVGRNMAQILVRNEFPEVDWLKVVDDDDLHSSMAFLVQRFHTFFNDPKYPCDSEDYKNVILRTNVPQYKGIAANLYNTRCPYCLNGLLNSYAVQGEDGVSLKLYKMCNMVTELVDYQGSYVLSDTSYFMPSSRYEILSDDNRQLIMRFQQYLRMVAAVNPEAAQKLLQTTKSLSSTLNTYGAHSIYEKRNMYEVIPVLVSSDMRNVKLHLQTLTRKLKMRNLDYSQMVTDRFSKLSDTDKETITENRNHYKAYSCMKEMPVEVQNQITEVHEQCESLIEEIRKEGMEIETLDEDNIINLFSDYVDTMDENKLIEAAMEDDTPQKIDHVVAACLASAFKEYKHIMTKYGFDSTYDFIKTYDPVFDICIEQYGINYVKDKEREIAENLIKPLDDLSKYLYEEEFDGVDYYLFNLNYELKYNFAIPTNAKSKIIDKVKVVVKENGECNTDLNKIMYNKDVVSVIDCDNGEEYCLHDWNLKLFKDVDITKLKGGENGTKQVINFIIWMMIAVLIVALVIKMVNMCLNGGRGGGKWRNDNNIKLI